MINQWYSNIYVIAFKYADMKSDCHDILTFTLNQRVFNERTHLTERVG